jgi:predicted RecA/RadA family phage recombinase
MAKNYVKDGTVLTYDNTGAAISSGDVVVVGNLLGVAIPDIAATSGSGTVQIVGVFDLPKVDAAVIAQGEMVIWDSSAGAFDDNAATPASGDVSNAAIAMESLGATTGANIQVKLNVSPGTVTP